MSSEVKTEEKVVVMSVYTKCRFRRHVSRDAIVLIFFILLFQLEEIINIEALDRLKDAFTRADKDGQKKLTETQFQGVLREALGMRNQQEDQVSYDL